MVDALASGASTGNGVEVRVLSWAPHFQENMRSGPIDRTAANFGDFIEVRLAHAAKSDT